MKPQRDNKKDFSSSKPDFRVIKSSGPTKNKKRPSGNFVNIRVDFDSRKFEGPIRAKIRQIVAEEVVRIFNTICAHCNRRYEYEGRKKPVLSLIALPELTIRQKEIMDLVVLKKSDRQISRILDIELSTVKNHMKNIKTKLGIHTRTDARDQYLSLKEEEAEKNKEKKNWASPGVKL
jgi:DNA-binding CsgD family transcriptional regulator